MLSTAELLDAIRRYPLLTAAQLEEVGRDPPEPGVESRVVAARWIERGWLTPYQVNRLLQGRVDELVLGSYVMMQRLGEGAMGAVFKARDSRRGQIVALKVIGKEWLKHPDAIRRFRREVRAASQLNHPNIVCALDADEIDGTHFLAMEFVEGSNLEQLVVNQGALPIAAACNYVRQAALGLAHAHERGLVHRDIKPANLLLLADGSLIKILDLGLARIAQPEGGAGSLSMLTQEGSMMGSPDYLAPEQANDAHTADGRADQYSLGCTLYHLLTGRVPFEAKNVVLKILKHRTEQPFPIELIRPEVPAEVIAVVNRLMAKDPAQRYPNAAAVAEALAGPASRSDSSAFVTPLSLAPVSTAAGESLPGASVVLEDAIRRGRSVGRSGMPGGLWLWVVLGAGGGFVLVLGLLVVLALYWLL